MDEQPNVSKNIIDHRAVATHGLVAIMAFILGLLGRPAPVSPLDPDHNLVQVTSTALDRGQEFWAAELGPAWHDARVILIDHQEQTPCGPANQESGPFYCPPNERIYLDMSFLLAIRGELARAYVTAHELGHAVQKIRGELNDRPSIDIELGADTYAGCWMHDEQLHGHLATGDIEAALAEAAAVGDDRLCPECTQESWTHGSSAMRQAALQRGLDGKGCEGVRP